MASTRNDPDRDLDWIPRSYEHGPEVPRRTSTPKKQLTASQQNYKERQNARAAEAAHNAVKGRPMLEPSAEALAQMTPEEHAERLNQIRAIRAGLAAGEATANQQLSLDDVDPDELDPGRPF